MHSLAIRAAILITLFCFYSPAIAVYECEATADVDDFEDAVCDEDYCDATVEVKVEIDECLESRGTVTAVVDIDSDREREVELHLNWFLLDDNDTEIEQTVRLREGEWIDDLDIDKIECECLDEKN